MGTLFSLSVVNKGRVTLQPCSIIILEPIHTVQTLNMGNRGTCSDGKQRFHSVVAQNRHRLLKDYTNQIVPD